MPLDISTLGGWIRAVSELIHGVLRLDAHAFQAAVAHPNGLWIAFIVFLLAGLSIGLGQSVVLFANRVPRRRFFLTLLGAALVGFVTALLWALAVRLTLHFIFGVQISLRDVVVVVALGFVPGVWGIFLFLPYLGVVFGWVLRAWIFITILVGVGVVTGLNFRQTLVACGLGWLLFEFLTRMPFFDVDRLYDRVWRAATGRPQRYTGEDLAAWLAEEAQASLAARDSRGGGA